ncbi:MAG TPA: ABC transporter ATP-binding protein [Pseudobdellovibrionaceae bacterium]|nr:ABC transporter ATP-binding protein [Pseudobdellovibrionaceae bacterium]
MLKGINLRINQGEAIAVLGASGSGKSTFLQILGTLDRPTEGEIFFRGNSLSQKQDVELSYFRNREMGFVFQFHHLIMELTALENVMLPLQIKGDPQQFAKKQAMEWLDRVGLADRAKHTPSELSGGELQRVAIARALINRPRVLLADEPTGNLDSENALIVQNLFFDLQRSHNLSMVVVTHDLNFAARFPRIHRIKDGQWQTTD